MGSLPVENWGKKNKEFLLSLERLLSISKQTLMNKGLKGKLGGKV